MKKYLPFILPVLALLLVAYFGWRWYRGLTTEEIAPPEVTAGTPIEDLSGDELARLEALRQGRGDFQTIKMEATGDEALGEIRYQMADGKALFSLNANLPTNDNQIYHLYVKKNGQSDFQDVQTLSYEKGGLLASSSVSVEDLPAEIEVRLGTEVVLRATLPAPQPAPSEALIIEDIEVIEPAEEKENQENTDAEPESGDEEDSQAPEVSD